MRVPLRSLTVLATSICWLLPALASASDLDAAKASGAVGERLDGYVGAVRDGPPADIRALVDEVNKARRERYAEIAARNGISIEAVAAQAGAKLLERAEPGQWVFDATGKWKRK